MRLNQKETERYLNNFAKYVIQQSRSNLTRQDKNVDKKLYNSLDKEIEVGANSFRLSFLMEDYGKFQDKGVSGVKKKYDTQYSFKTKKLMTWLLFEKEKIELENKMLKNNGI